MLKLLATLESAPLSVWMREDPYAYFVALIFHAFGMALLAGGGILMSLCALAPGTNTPLAKFRALLPAMWTGAVLAICSGLLLLAAYPAKALTNPVFALKFICLMSATALAYKMTRPAAAPRTHRLSAALSLTLWLGGVAAGKLLLHTYSMLMVSDG